MTHFRTDGQISEVEYHNSDGSISRTINDYDSAGKLKESRSRSNDGTETRSLYHYDDSGRLVRVVNIDRNGQQHDYEIYNYDLTGRKTAQRFVPVERSTGRSQPVVENRMGPLKLFGTTSSTSSCGESSILAMPMETY